MNQPPTTRFRAAGLSDVGRARPHNEDAFFVGQGRGLFLVSDGMGGQQAGALAAHIVVEVLPRIIEAQLALMRRARAEAIRRMLQQAVADLSRQMHQQSSGQPGLRGMGATVAAALVRGRRVHLVHLGDSRVYRYRDGQLEPLTRDHSIVGLLLRAGEITPEQAIGHSASGQLSRYVGMDSEVRAEVQTVGARADDRLLLCSDGLWGMVPDATTASILRAHPDTHQACQALLAAANAAGGKDNITALLIDFAGRDAGGAS
jgi:protein phosphatase